jgi:hypothetical protein
VRQPQHREVADPPRDKVQRQPAPAMQCNAERWVSVYARKWLKMVALLSE